MIPTVERLAIRKTHVIGKMAGSPQSFNTPILALHDLSVAQGLIWLKRGIGAFAPAKFSVFGEVFHKGSAPRMRGTKRQNGGSGFGGEGAGEGGMVAMGMCYENVRYFLARLKRPQDRVEVAGVVRPGIDHRKLGRAEQIGIGPAKGHWGGVGCEDEAKVLPERDNLTGLGIEICRVGHSSLLSLRLAMCIALPMFFQWLKRYMPRSLYGRAALILLLPIVTLQLAVSVAFIQRHFATVTEQLTAAVVLELEYLRDEVENSVSPDIALARLSRAFEMEGHFVVAQSAPEQDYRTWYDLTGRRVFAELRGGLPGVRAVSLPNDRRVTLWLETDAGLAELRFRRDRLSASNPHQLLVIMIVLGTILTVVSFVFLRNQLRPIRRLGIAAEAFGKGRHVPYRPTGALEVRAAGNAFLDMRARIERQIEQRTLMLSGVSHDLRTPLTRLKLGLSLLDDVDREPLERDVDEMREMLDAFLDFARGEAESPPEPVDPVALVAMIVDDARRSGRSVSIVSSEGTGEVRLRVGAIRRAVENLIGNAVRYGTKAEISVALTAKALRISVEDDGPGIPEAQRAEAIKPFSRLEPGRNQNRGAGVGLGLAIATDIARAHGGALRLSKSERLGGLRVDLVIGR
ncbi:Signal transduction histidine kinase [Poseidonocella pacifica]|uniref:histidine kinase n=2 Tax=Poseidonocella pacifica TaxID=871651 RepID=A0A1I0YN06_9RHOB|nr:Signal transduction histidine kinase [Poseidonocella pacifica]